VKAEVSFQNLTFSEGFLRNKIKGKNLISHWENVIKKETLLWKKNLLGFYPLNKGGI